MAKATQAEPELNAREQAEADQARVAAAVGTPPVFVHETPQDPLQQRVDAAMAALHRGDEDPQAAADAVEKKQKAAGK
jgi:ABC-type glycerol-3-phosphate transport system substrate-binding protein